MEYAIRDRGRGPEIAGSRITVYDVLAETRAGVSVEQLVREWQLDVAQIELALRYIEEHREEVEREWAIIKARHARGNPPEIQKKIDETHARMAPLWEEWKKGNRAPMMQFLEERRKKQHEGNGNADAPIGREHTGTCRDSSTDS